MKIRGAVVATAGHQATVAAHSATVVVATAGARGVRVGVHVDATVVVAAAGALVRVDASVSASAAVGAAARAEAMVHVIKVVVAAAGARGVRAGAGAGADSAVTDSAGGAGLLSRRVRLSGGLALPQIEVQILPQLLRRLQLNVAGVLFRYCPFALTMSPGDRSLPLKKYMFFYIRVHLALRTFTTSTAALRCGTVCAGRYYQEQQ